MSAVMEWSEFWTGLAQLVIGVTAVVAMMVAIFSGIVWLCDRD